MTTLKTFYILVLSLILYSSLTAILTNARQSVEVYIYDFPDLQRLKEIKNYFSKLPESKITVYYLNRSHCLNEFLDIVNLLIRSGIVVFPSDACVPCILNKLSWQEIYVTYASPLLLFFHEGRLTAIVISKYDAYTLDQARKASNDTVIVFTRDGSNFILDEETKVEIEQLFKDRVKPRIKILQIFPLIVAAALTDAINPCEFFVLIVFLSLVISRLGRKAVLKFGFAYSIAIFIIYFMMGLGIWRLLGYVREAKIFVVILGFSLGLRSILNFVFSFFGISIGLREFIGSFLNRKFKRIPSSFSNKITEYLRKFSNNPSSAFTIGIITSAFLLPCTSGPYLIAISLISNLESQIYGIILLLIYNSIIIVPFLTITIGIYMLKLKTSELKRFSSARQRWLNLVGGLIMIALSIYLMIYAL